MSSITLRADCAQCAALCCVALAFDRSALFAIDKAAGEPCQNLSDLDRCTIHADRAAQGFAGCAGYDCLGAGQRVTAMFIGQSWRDGLRMAAAMFEAFSAMRKVNELMLLLRAAQKMPLEAAHRLRCDALLARLDTDWTVESLSAFAAADVSHDVMAFLAELRGYAPSLRDTSCARRRAGRSCP
ncbi:MAG: hypothetical protein ABMA14_07100 [Hyphomonadaceae bacterium]